MYEKDIILNDHSIIHLRPGVKQDFEMLWTMLSTLSEESLQFLHNRFIKNEIKSLLMHLDYEELLPIVAITRNNSTGSTACGRGNRGRRGRSLRDGGSESTSRQEVSDGAFELERGVLHELPDGVSQQHRPGVGVV